MDHGGLESILAPGGKVIKFRAPVRGEATAEQNEIGPGDCFISIPGPQWPVIYGHVWTRQDHVEELRRDRLGPMELESELAWREYRAMLGYRWGSCYSVIEPDGEDGETHVSTCRKITVGEFDAARQRGWA
jgi:hypothetical protein